MKGFNSLQKIFWIIPILNIALVSLSSKRATADAIVKPKEEYQCLPCGNSCDTITYTEPGTCAHCHMALVKKATITFKNIQPADICNYIKQHPDVVLLDVRTKQEFEGKASPNYGTLKNAINIPVQELEIKLASISSLKNKDIIVYCSHSHRSPEASYLLTQNGFKHITNMAGGMSALNDDACKR